MPYIVALISLCAVYVLALYLMRYAKRGFVCNFFFLAVVLGCYLTIGVIVYSDVGFYDWNFQNLMPVANVSPFMFATAPLFLLAPKRVRGYGFLLISLLSVGMFLSGVFGCVYNAVIHYKFHFHFLLDYIAHFALSLFGIYLIRTGQARFTRRGFFVSSAMIFGVALVMLLLNLIFDTSFFGLSLNGKHNIYNVVLVGNSYLSALIYFIGLMAVLLLGAAAAKLASAPCFALFTKEKNTKNYTIQ